MASTPASASSSTQRVCWLFMALSSSAETSRMVIREEWKLNFALA